MTMAILALLAWKAVKHFGGSQPGAAPAPAPPLRQRQACRRCGGGGLGDLLKGGLGGLLAGGAAGSIFSGGLGDLLKQFQQNGQGDSRQFMGQQGPEQADRAGRSRQRARRRPDQCAASSQTGLSRDELLQGLSQYLPDVINHLTPDGRLPNENELSGRL